jgi:DNA-binding NarL/FixJ family response regulator
MEWFTVLEAKEGIDALKLLKEQIPDLIIFGSSFREKGRNEAPYHFKGNSKLGEYSCYCPFRKKPEDLINKVFEAGAEEFLSKMVTTPAKLAETAKAVIMFNYKK